eukprot:1192555-Prorocentrum_minimum.AAC.2
MSVLVGSTCICAFSRTATTAVTGFLVGRALGRWRKWRQAEKNALADQLLAEFRTSAKGLLKEPEPYSLYPLADAVLHHTNVEDIIAWRLLALTENSLLCKAINLCSMCWIAHIPERRKRPSDHCLWNHWPENTIALNSID